MARLAWVFAAAVAVAACGGDDDDDGGGGDTDGGGGGDVDGGGGDGATCEAFAPCGGDPVGEWTAEAVCATGGEVDGCPEGTIDYSGLTLTGTLSLRDDGTFETNVRPSGTLVYSFPQSCLPTDTSCAQIGGDTLTCVEAADGCDCSQEVNLGDGDPGDGSTVGTWSAAGTTLTIDDDDDEGPGDTAPYCVDGDALLLGFDQDGATVTYLLTR